jgi:hypothetical protein
VYNEGYEGAMGRTSRLVYCMGTRVWAYRATHDNHGTRLTRKPAADGCLVACAQDDFFVHEVFSEVCHAVAHMHMFSPPYAHRDIKVWPAAVHLFYMWWAAAAH